MACTLTAGVALSLLCLLTWHLLFFWEVNPQYSYGWIVPVLSIYLSLRRWSCRPYSQAAPSWTSSGLVLCLIALGPIWLVREATPDWSAVTWLLALAIVGTLLLLTCQLGGTPWLIHFAFPICFILTAVPWPQRIDLAVVQGLMRFVANTASELLNWNGFAAFATGNLIQLPAGSVAIDEACSGIRSLQAMLMLSLFLGEFRNLNLIWRAALMAFAVVAALALNLLRTTALVFVVARWGVSAFDAWHVPLGHALFIAGLILLSGSAFLLKPRPERTNQTGISQFVPLKFRPLVPFASVAILLWLAAIVCGTELWYASNEQDVQHVTLAVTWPSALPGHRCRRWRRKPALGPVGRL
jgi:exosortase